MFSIVEIESVVLALAAHVLELERYREDQRGPVQGGHADLSSVPQIKRERERENVY